MGIKSINKIYEVKTVKNNNVNAIEMVIFEANPGFNEKEVKTSMESLNSILTSCNGFVSRQLAISEDSQWMDLVFWESMEEAKTAAENIMEKEIAKKAFSVINEQTMMVYHFNPIN